MTALIRYIVVLCFILFPLFASAADHAVRAPADCTYNGNGTTWACAESAGAAGAYDGIPATLVRGDVYYLGDGEYPGYKVDDAVVGTTYIYIKKATASAHGPAGSWDNAYGDGVVTFLCNLTVSTGVPTALWLARNYVSIDGVVGGGPGSWKTGHGIVINLDADYDSKGIVLGDPTNGKGFTGGRLSNIEIAGHTDWRPAIPPASGCGIAASYNSGNMSYHNSDIVLNKLYIHHIGGQSLNSTAPSDTYTVENSLFDTDSTGNGYAHGIFLRFNCSQNITIRNNRFANGVGTGQIGFYGGSVAVECPAGYGNTDNKIYGNYFYCEDSVNRCGGYSITYQTTNSLPAASGARVYNNTFYNLHSMGTVDGVVQNVQGLASVQVSGGDNLFSNNLTYGTLPTESDCRTVLNFTNDYNAGDYTGITTTDSHWQQLTESPFVSTDPDNANFLKLSAATTAGVTLDSPYNTDFLDTVRGSDGTWDRGAAEYGGEADTDTPDIQAGGAIVGTSGTTFTLALDEYVTVADGTGFTLACDGGEGEGLSYVSVSGGTLTFNVTGRIIDDDETCTLDYTTVANGIEDAAGNDLESIGDPIAVTNNSTHTPTAVTYTITVQRNSWDVTLSPSENQIVISGENSTTFTCTPSNGWQCAWGGTCGATGNGTTYQKTAIDADCTVTLTATEIYLLN